MQYFTFPGTDLKVSRICLGTAFRSGRDKSDCEAVIRSAADAGCNFLDTANNYRDGLSEQIVGKTIKDRRDEFVVASKVGTPVPADRNPGGLSRTAVLRCVEQSLKRLKTDHLDLYHCHFPDEETPIEETMEVMDELVRQGKIRHVGLSSYETWRMKDVVRICEAGNFAKPICNQVLHNLIDRSIEENLVPACRADNVAITVFSPTAIGLLSGRHRYGEPPPKDSSWYLGPYNYRAVMTPLVGDVIRTLLDVSKEAGHTPFQVSAAWCLQRGADVAILGADTVEHARTNMKAGDITLSADALDRLDEVSDGLRTPIRHDCPDGYEGSS
jgi:aryl-alcohol dehydrogenase-like predicted oxidoreductase